MTTKPFPKLKKDMTIVFDGHSWTNRRRDTDGWVWPFLQLMAWDHSWPDYFSQLLFCWRPQLNLRFFNHAIGGSNSRHLTKRASTIAEKKPDLVLITIGTNDQPANIPLDEFRENILHYVKAITASGQAQIIFVGWTYFHLPELEKKNSQYAKELPARNEYQTVLKEIAADQPKVHYLDITQGFQEKGEAIYAQSSEHTIYNDGSHYNTVGAYLIAGEVLQAFGVVTASD